MSNVNTKLFSGVNSWPLNITEIITHSPVPAVKANRVKCWSLVEAVILAFSPFAFNSFSPPTLLSSFMLVLLPTSSTKSSYSGCFTLWVTIWPRALASVETTYPSRFIHTGNGSSSRRWASSITLYTKSYILEKFWYVLHTAWLFACVTPVSAASTLAVCSYVTLRYEIDHKVNCELFVKKKKQKKREWSCKDHTERCAQYSVTHFVSRFGQSIWLPFWSAHLYCCPVVVELTAGGNCLVVA